jgi:GTPase
MRPIPSHYQPVTYVDGFWEKAGVLGLQVKAGAVHLGDRLAYELPVDFMEEDLTSLQLDNRSVDQAEAGDHVGVKTSLNKAQARNNMAVYRVHRASKTT